MNRGILGIAAALALAATPAAAQQQKISFVLNWVPGGDHAPYYWAKKRGLYAQAGIDLEIEQGRGSAFSAQRIGAGSSQMGISDMGVVLTAKGKGADMVAVQNIYANSPQGFYWLKSSGIKGVRDMAGKRVGNPPGDAARAMWPALARAHGMTPEDVRWVNIDANAKLSALKAKSIDATTSFYNLHHVFTRELGDDMGYLAWKDAGVNPYGNSVVVNAAFLRANRKAVADFVRISQKAFSDCVATPQPCVEALVEANGALKLDNELENWRLVTVLMSDETSRSVALGWHDPKRMADDYKLVETYLKLDQPYDVATVFTNEFLDQSIKMTAVKTN